MRFRRGWRTITGSLGLVGLGASTASFGMVLPSFARDAAMSDAFQSIPFAERLVSVTIANPGRTASNGNDQSALDRAIRDRLSMPALATGTVRHQVLYRTLASPSGIRFRVASAEPLADALVMASGDVPKRCTAQPCEVVLLFAKRPVGSTIVSPGREDDAVRNEIERALGVSVVGVVKANPSVLFQGSFAADADEVLVLVESDDAARHIPMLERVGRSEAWVAPLARNGVRSTRLNEWRRAIGSLDNSLPAWSAKSQAASPDLRVAAPERSLLEGRARGNRAAGVWALVGGLLLALFGGAALLAALRQRRWHATARDALVRRGVSSRNLRAFSRWESAPIMIAVAIGSSFGGTMLVWIAGRLVPSTEPIALADHWRTIVRSSIGLSAACGVLPLLLRRRDVFIRVEKRARFFRVTPIDWVGAASVALLTAALSRGRVQLSPVAGSVAMTSAVRVLYVVPVLAIVAIGWVSLRSVDALRYGFGAIHRRRSVSWRSHAAGATSETANSVTRVSAALASSALVAVLVLVSLRATTDQTVADRAVSEVPYDYRILSGSEGVRPSDRRVTERAKQRGLVATDVLRRSLSLRARGVSGVPIEVLGVDRATLSAMRETRRDIGPSAASLLPGTERVSRLSVDPAARLPRGATTISVAPEGAEPNLGLSFVLRRVDGRWVERVARRSVEQQRAMWLAQLDEGDESGEVVGLRIGLDPAASVFIEHHIGEAGTSSGLFAFDVSIRELIVRTTRGTTSVRPDWALFESQSGAVESKPSRGAIRIQGRTEGSRALLVRRMAADHRASGTRGSSEASEASEASKASEATDVLDAIVDPITARAAVRGIVELNSSGPGIVRFRVVGVRRSFPTVGPRFAIVDLRPLQTNLDRRLPGSGTPDEAWIGNDQRPQRGGSHSVVDAFASEGVTVIARSDVARAISGSVVARRTQFMLLAAAAVAFMVTITAFGTVIVNLSQELLPRATFLRISGVALASLRRVLTTTLLLWLVPGALAAIAVAVLVVRSLPDFVSITLDGARVQQSVRAVLPTGSVVLVLIAVLASVGGIALMQARSVGHLSAGDPFASNRRGERR